MTESNPVFSVSEADFQARVVDASQDTPVVVDFWAEWCAPCHQLMPVLSKVIEGFDGKIRLAKVNTEEQPKLATQFGVRSLPTVMIFKNGQPIDQFSGALPEGQIRDFLSKHVPRESDTLRRQAAELYHGGEVEQALEVLKQANGIDPDNHDVLLDIAKISANQGQLDLAWEILESLPVDVATRQAVKELKAQIGLARQADGGSDVSELQARIEADGNDLSAREKLAATCAMQGDYEAALEQYLQMMRRDRSFNDDAGRRGLLDLFEMLGSDNPLTKAYRRRMFSLLH